MSIVEFVILVVSIILLGVGLGMLVRWELRTKKCPYCSCKDYCAIGYGIKSKTKPELQSPYMCHKTSE